MAHTSNPVRVSLPASVAADIGSLKKAVGSVLDRLGCPACCSGHDIWWQLQRDFVFRDEISKRAEILPQRQAAKASVSTVAVGLQPEAAGKIDNVYAAIDRIAELSGHPACATGCDMLFRLEQVLVIDERLNIDEQIMSIG